MNSALIVGATNPGNDQADDDKQTQQTTDRQAAIGGSPGESISPGDPLGRYSPQGIPWGDTGESISPGDPLGSHHKTLSLLELKQL